MVRTLLSLGAKELLLGIAFYWVSVSNYAIAFICVRFGAEFWHFRLSSPISRHMGQRKRTMLSTSRKSVRVLS